jgi:hypothetical protein
VETAELLQRPASQPVTGQNASGNAVELSNAWPVQDERPAAQRMVLRRQTTLVMVERAVPGRLLVDGSGLRRGSNCRGRRG